ncbi:MAG: NAD(P)/FAD-dependent oxidoreductase [Bryobacteraceae bacterium]
MYDAIIVGARVAGSATALLLARRGMKVLLVDKASFPSDTISTHYVHQAGIARLNRWGLLDRLRATGCPPITRTGFDFGAFAFAGSAPAAEGGITEAFAPTRIVLDKLMADAAVEAGCELRENCAVEALSSGGGRVTGIRGNGFTEQADIVIGADGMHSLVARLTDAPQYDLRPALTCVYYGYWSGVPETCTDIRIHERHSTLTFPTNGGLTMAIVSTAISEFPRIRLDHQAAYLEAIPDKVRVGRLESRVYGTADLANFYRKPYGPGWALVGDAGFHKDPLTAQGITDAFRDADMLSEALTGGRSRESALERYEQQRNAATRAMYQLTCERASYEPPPEPVQRLLFAISKNQEAADRFAGIDAGTVRVEDFFHPDSVQRILARAL